MPRLGGAALALTLLFTASFAPATAGCPTLTPTEIVRAAELKLRPINPNAVAIDIAALSKYCRKAVSPLLCKGAAGGKLPIASVRAVDQTLRQQFEYRADYTRFGTDDLWQAGVVCGDCEDYALTAAARLNLAGQGGAHMKMMLWFVGPGLAHATLLVDTADEGWVELGVGRAETEAPKPYRADRGIRLASITLDGKRVVQPEDGYVVVGAVVRPVDTAAKRP